MSSDRRAHTPDFARRFWDTAYAQGEDLAHWHREPPDEALGRVLAEGHPGPGARCVLDVGCGTGAEASWLAARLTRAWGAEALEAEVVEPAVLGLAARRLVVVGVDLSVTALARAAAAREPSPGGRWHRVVGSSFELPLADGTVDLVLDAGCLHTIGRRSRALYARELVRVSAPGARVLVRGARRDREEEGLFGVGPGACRRWLGPAFSVEWSMPLVLPASSGALDGVAVLLRRAGRGGT